MAAESTMANIFFQFRLSHDNCCTNFVLTQVSYLQIGQIGAPHTQNLGISLKNSGVKKKQSPLLRLQKSLKYQK
jgi:hypothetical protein